MLFSSLTFLFLFFPLCLLFYFISRKELKNIILLVFSLVFYAWGEPKYIILMLGVITVSYFSGLILDKLERYKKARLIVFVSTILLIIGSLIYFKYTNFLILNINRFFHFNISVKNIILPIGISFYTFQVLSYIIDLYRKKIKVQKNIFSLALYISFFPQLIAGPIVKYETVEDQLKNRKESFEKIIDGIQRFIIGLGKKVIIANQMALLADAFYNSSNIGEYSVIVIIICTLAYTLQIYFDFSGYSDMAIGLGKIFGFEFLENFNYPYIAKSITDFWKRWHISLTTFFREYLYIPLGGNRVKKIRWIFNMFIVWLLTGLWHGAAWNFILWGLYYFSLLLFEKLFFKNVLKHMPGWLRFLYTFILVNIGWMLFRVNSIHDLGFILNTSGNVGIIKFLIRNSSAITSIILLPLALLLSFDFMKKLDYKFSKKRFYCYLKKIALLGIFILSICHLASSMYNPFIYFRF